MYRQYSFCSIVIYPRMDVSFFLKLRAFRYCNLIYPTFCLVSFSLLIFNPHSTRQDVVSFPMSRHTNYVFSIPPTQNTSAVSSCVAEKTKITIIFLLTRHDWQYQHHILKLFWYTTSSSIIIKILSCIEMSVYYKLTQRIYVYDLFPWDRIYLNQL